MNKTTGKTVLVALSVLVGTSCTTTNSFAESNTTKVISSVHKKTVESKNTMDKLLEITRKEKAKEIIERIPESNPLTVEDKEDIMDYYADKYIPKKGCSLLDLPKDSNIDYVPPKKVKKKAIHKEKTNIEQSKNTSNTTKNNSFSNSTKKITSTPNGQFTTIIKSRTISMSDEERELLEKLVEAEAGNQPYEGIVAVATVIANRLDSPAFPNTVMDVIKAGNKERHQFQPFDDGRINKVTPSQNTKKAVTQVFDKGIRNLPAETVYFSVKEISFDDWMGKTRKYITTIGDHAFFSQYEKPASSK